MSIMQINDFYEKNLKKKLYASIESVSRLPNLIKIYSKHKKIKIHE